MKNISITLTEEESKELVAGLAARRRELDKAFKACNKADASAAAGKVMERMQTVDSAAKVLNEAVS